nr:crosslink repair DNA glycosylase YcaQ family protein [Actinomadura madurae]
MAGRRRGAARLGRPLQRAAGAGAAARHLGRDRGRPAHDPGGVAWAGGIRPVRGRSRAALPGRVRAASVRDVQHWSGLTRLGEVVERLLPKLVTFQDEEGRTLYDLPEAPRPDPGTPAPVRFVPDFDNLLLSHADRARIITEEQRKRVFTVNGIIRATFLVDGFVHGMWTMEKKRGEATLRIDPFDPVPERDRTALEEEGMGLLAAAHPEAKAHRVEFAA